MSEYIIDSYRIISANQLVRAIKEGKKNAERFCFILGSGASVSSGIPAGASLEYEWMKEMETTPGMKEVREIAKKLQEDGHLENDFAKIEKAWNETKSSGTPLPSEFYFDIYKLRFFPNHRNGYHYLENIMANKNPGFGYHPLALMLASGKGDNLVITTNFDSLVEDALFLYTDSKPLVINHELLADYAGDSNIKRPIIAKVHRGIFFDPLNQPEETNELKGRWHDVLVSVFQIYTPIVIGYGGGDNSLMKLLEEENVKMKNGIYWCYMEKYGLPNEKTQELVQNKKGYFVRTAGFDAIMLAIGNALFPDQIGVHETEKYLNNRTSMQIVNYEKEYRKLTEFENKGGVEEGDAQANQSENEFKEEIEKMTERGAVSENERQEKNQLTAWDYWRQGRNFYDSMQYQDAIESYTKAIDVQKNVADFYCSRGDAWIKQEQYNEAIHDYERAIELEPENAVFYNNRGYAYECMNKLDKAIGEYGTAIELDPNEAIIYSNRGNVYSELGSYDKAFNDYKKALKLDSKCSTAYMGLGDLYELLGNDSKAIDEYSKAITVAPKDSMIYNNRGYLYLKLEDYDKAISDLNMAIDLEPDYANPYKHYGTILKKKGDYKVAIDYLTTAISLDSKYKKAYLERAEVYRMMGEEEKAKADEMTAESL